MKSLIKISFVVVALMATSCTPQWLLVNSSGIATYNRNTGQVEVLWENKSAQQTTVHDTVYVVKEVAPNQE
jgi:hypothetical protein